ncbi:MAG: DUF2339 domain-containing protein [Bacteroidota bacterium]
MPNNDDKIKNLESKINTLNDYLKYCIQQINDLKQELNLLKGVETKAPISIQKVEVTETIVDKTPEPISVSEPVFAQAIITEAPIQQTSKPAKKIDLEEYIGGNLIAKIGIVILVIGVAFGVKYAVDAGYINPLTRIVLAFTLGGGLLFTAFKLKTKYELFSAVLLSGAMATLYLSTYAGFAWYDLYPRGVAFALMLVFTAFTVFAATMYNNQWIALFGLVGAYCIPFLTSNNSGNIALFFSYVAIINIGIVILSFKRYWIWLSHSAFVLTLAIFASWFGAKYNQTDYLYTALGFSFLNFITFYISFLAYKVLKQEVFSWRDVLLVFLNNVFYFSMGLTIIEPLQSGVFMGLFAAFNALLHFGVGYYLYKKTNVDKNIFYLLLSFVIAFSTIAIPLQLNGVWVSLFLSAELILLAYIGFVKQINFYKWFAFALTFIALFSLIDDYSLAYSYPYYAPLENVSQIPFFNLTFLSSVLYLVAISLLLFYSYRDKSITEKSFKGIGLFVYSLIPLVIIMSYTVFFIEIADKFYIWHAQSGLKTTLNIGFGETTSEYQYDYSIRYFKNVWLVNYSFVYAGLFAWLAIKKIKNKVFVYLSIAIWLITLFLAIPNIAISFINLIDCKTHEDAGFSYSNWNVAVRYVSYPFLLIALYSIWQYSKYESFNKTLSNIFKAAFAVYLLMILSIELACLAQMNEVFDNTGKSSVLRRFGYTLLWGFYSLSLIVYGIKKKSKVLRITAICIFGITLIKLFVIDIQTLSKGFKIVAFLALGALLLTVSFLYQKFAKIIFASDEEPILNENNTPYEKE